MRKTEIPNENRAPCKLSNLKPLTADLSRRVLATEQPVVHLMKEAMYERIERGQEVLDFGQALVSFRPPTLALEELRKLVIEEPAVHHLGPVAGLRPLRKAIAQYRSEIFAENISEENVVVTLGANHAFQQVIAAVTDPGDEVMLLSPYFFNHKMTLGLQGNRIAVCPTDEGNGFQPNLQGIERQISTDTRALVVVNPGNPTGSIIPGKKLLELESTIDRCGGRLIVDESYAYFDFRLQAEPLPLFNLEKTVIIGSFSKSFSLAGWRIGYIIASSELTKQLIKTQDASAICAPIAAQHMALAALQKRQEHFDTILPELSKRRQLLFDGLCQSGGFESVSGDGGVFLFAKLRGNRRSFPVAEKLLHDIGIVTSPGLAWGAEGYLRFSYGRVTEEQIERACLLLQECTSAGVL